MKYDSSNDMPKRSLGHIIKASRTVSPKIPSREYQAWNTWILSTDANWCRTDSIEYLAAEIGASRSAANRAIAALKQMGLLEVEPRALPGYGKVGSRYHFKLDTSPQWDSTHPLKSFTQPMNRRTHIEDWTVSTDHERNHKHWGIDVEFGSLLDAFRSSALQSGQMFRSSWDQTFGAFLKAVRDDELSGHAWWWIEMPDEEN